MNLQSSDLLIAAKLAVRETTSDASVRNLGAELGLSKSTVSNSLQRLRAFKLVRKDNSVNRLALADCFQHAIRWLAPAQVGDFELGLPTAHASEAMSAKMTGDDDPVVMPLAHGPVRGRAVAPIHPKAPEAAKNDPKLLRLLAIVDVFRIGGARERQVASVALLACL
jgi:hypothetical protein